MGRVPVQELRARIGLVEPAFGRAVLPGRTPLHLVLSGATGTLATLADRIGPDEEAHARRLLAEVGAAELADRAIGTCSEGERARILLARALMLDAPLLVLDEPAGGLDLPGRELLLAALARSAAARPGLATSPRRTISRSCRRRRRTRCCSAAAASSPPASRTPCSRTRR